MRACLYAFLFLTVGSCTEPADPAAHTSASGQRLSGVVTHTGDTGAVASSSLSAPVEWRYVGPGGMGAVLAVSPVDGTDQIFAGSDVGGLFYTSDEGASWSQPLWYDDAAGARHPLEIHDVDTTLGPAGIRVTWLATSEGIFRGGTKTFVGVEGIPRLTPADNQDGDADSDLEEHAKERDLGGWGDRFERSVQSVAIAPSDHDTVWFGMGRAGTPDIWNEQTGPGFGERERFHPHTVYFTTNAGADINPRLQVPGATVFDIAIHPEDSDRVWIATNKGLYYSANAGGAFDKWYEIGIEDVQISEDHGATWQTCTANPACEVRWQSHPDCVISGLGPPSCLPIVASANEEHPNVRDVDV